MSGRETTRRRILASLLAAAPVSAQQLIGEPEGRIAPLGELVNLLEFELMAKRKLPAAVFAAIAGGDREREDFDRITFRPRSMSETTKLNLTTELLGVGMFAPIILGPAAEQKQIHGEGELAMVRGAAAAKAVAILSSKASYPLEQVLGEAKGPVWFQISAGVEELVRAQLAVKLGCKVIVITMRNPLRPDWAAIERLRKAIPAAVVVKGIMTPAEALIAVERGAQGIIVSSYGGVGLRSPIAVLPAIADAVGGRIPVLVDGGFRRGTDVLKALILGATAVLVTRPALWGLGGYGASGVQAVMEMLQTELARNLIMIGAATPKALNRNMIRIHATR